MQHIRLSVDDTPKCQSSSTQPTNPSAPTPGTPKTPVAHMGSHHLQQPQSQTQISSEPRFAFCPQLQQYLPIATPSTPPQSGQPHVCEKQPRLWQWRIALILMMIAQRRWEISQHVPWYHNYVEDNEDRPLKAFEPIGMFIIFWIFVSAGAVGIILTWMWWWVGVGLGVVALLLDIFTPYALAGYGFTYTFVLFFGTGMAMQVTHVVSTRWVMGRKCWPLFTPSGLTSVVDAVMGPGLVIWVGSVVSDGTMGNLWHMRAYATPALIVMTTLVFAGILACICLVHFMVGLVVQPTPSYEVVQDEEENAQDSNLYTTP